MRRRFLLSALLLLLTACGREEAEGPFTDSRIPPALAQRFWPPPSWAWGLVSVADAPAIRYGVAAPRGHRRGDVLILTGYGESAEDGFETVGALNDAGYVVWVLEGAGQAGSGRYTRPHDLVHVPDLSVEAGAVRAMTAIIGRPVVLAAQSTAAPAALDAVIGGATVRAVVLSDPVTDPAQPPLRAEAAKHGAPGVARLHLGWMRALGQRPWAGPEVIPAGRAGVADLWRQANPDLRMGGASWGWIAAFDRRSAGLTPARLGRIAAPVVILRSGPERVEPLCGHLERCEVQHIAGRRETDDTAYRAWLAALEAMLAKAFPDDGA